MVSEQWNLMEKNNYLSACFQLHIEPPAVVSCITAVHFSSHDNAMRAQFRFNYRTILYICINTSSVLVNRVLRQTLNLD